VRYTGDKACENNHKLPAEPVTAPPRISDSALRRLSHYLRFLEAFEAEGRPTISSEDLAERGGTTSAQVRKDLSHFGSFGKRGLGYPVAELRARLGDILGVGRRWDVALVGAGKLGAALYAYDGFRRRGFHVVAVFDSDPRKIGRRWGQLEIEDVAALAGATFEVMLIPYTLTATTLDALRVGQAVNIETDVIGKYVVRSLALKGAS